MILFKVLIITTALQRPEPLQIPWYDPDKNHKMPFEHWNWYLMENKGWGGMMYYSSSGKHIFH